CQADNNAKSDGGVPDSGTDTEPHFKRVVALGDNHADLAQVLMGLQIGGVIDGSQSWVGGDTIVVQTGDIIDRGVAERQVIDFYEELRPQAEAAGGQIINMNGNHEIMTAYGDYRYMQEGACGAFADLEGLDTSNPAFDEFTNENCKLRAAAFWPGGPYAQIIADWPMVAVVQDTVFVHGGLHQKHLDYGIDEINAMTEAWLLGEGNLTYSQVGGGTDVFSVDWDRTYSDDEFPPTEEDCANLASVLEQLGVARMAVGHTVWDHINPACDELVWRIDTGMAIYYGGDVEVFEVKDGEVNVLVDLAG
ncbi:MAG: metallophosphoesterase, partial [Deltaproteobacteria bacterium]|nr:metallophosphoesterase [Deltaproteobacteria bacterium]